MMELTRDDARELLEALSLAYRKMDDVYWNGDNDIEREGTAILERMKQLEKRLTEVAYGDE